MAKQARFALVYAAQVKEHLRAIEPKYHALIRSVLEAQLGHRPEVETRNRKPLLRAMALGADWELRCGPGNRFRVFYQVDVEGRQVLVLAIGVKDGSQLRIGGEEVGP